MNKLGSRWAILTGKLVQGRLQLWIFVKLRSDIDQTAFGRHLFITTQFHRYVRELAEVGSAFYHAPVTKLRLIKHQ